MPAVLIAGLSDDLGAWLGQRVGSGVTVTATHTGKETMDALARGGWSLLILDSGISDPPALEVLAQARASMGAVELPVIFCLESKSTSAQLETLVDQLGGIRLMFHPFDREVLAGYAGSLLGIAPQPEGAQPGRQQQTAAAIADVWQRFKGVTLNRVAVVDQAAVAALEQALSSDQRRQAEREAHKLAGSLGTFGFPRGSKLGKEVEQLLEGESPLLPAQVLRLSELAVALRQEVEREPEPPAAEIPHQAGRRPRLLVVERDASVAERLTMEAAPRGIEIEVAADARAAVEALGRGRPDAAVVEMTEPGGAQPALDLLAALAAQHPPVPALVVSDRDTFVDRVEVARLSGRGFLHKPLRPAEILDAAAELLTRTRPVKAKVMAVDDDPAVLAALRALLELQGIAVVTLEDPLRFWDVLEAEAPDLLVLDAEMQQISGIELCRVVRNDPRWKATPVLFLTAHTDPGTVDRVFAAGADDFVSKPLRGPELSARIANRLERMQLQRAMAETDFLTGLANRSKSTAILTQFFQLADRQQQPVSLAVVDLDSFKRVNDRYGHAAGDAVLRELGNILQQSFRGEDVVARWGGEEFMIGMYGMKKADGVARMAEILETMRGEKFTAPDGTRFGVTFSAGVAEYPADGSTLLLLYRAAAEALYQAKAAGRDMVLPTGWAPAQTAQAAQSVDVLLVDDDEMLAGLLLHALDTRGYRAQWLQDGQVAVEMLRGPAPALKARVVLLDVGLPGLDGLSVLRRLAQHGVLRMTRVIMLTVRSVEAEVLSALELGAFEHVAKPFSVPVLMQHIRRALES